MRKKLSIKYFIFLLVFCLGVYIADKKGLLFSIRRGIENLFTPLQKNIYTTSQNISSTFKVASYWKSGIKKISYLEERNRELLVKAVKVDILEAENKILREQLKVEKEQNSKLLITSVIGSKDGLKIDKGSLDGVKEGMVVISGSYLVGKISTITPTTSTVELPISSNSKISVVLSETDAKGILIGQFNSGLLLDSVLQNENLILGDIILTSGENGIFPPNLLIGKITKIEKNETAVFQKAIVEPLLNYSILKKVFVIKN